MLDKALVEFEDVRTTYEDSEPRIVIELESFLKMKRLVLLQKTKNYSEMLVMARSIISLETKTMLVFYLYSWALFHLEKYNPAKV